MKKFNLDIAMLLLLSCVGTAFSMEEDIAKEQQQKSVLECLKRYKKLVVELRTNEHSFKKQFDDRKMSFDDYNHQCISISDRIKRARSTYETLTNLNLGHPFNIETTDLKKFAESDFVVRVVRNK